MRIHLQVIDGPHQGQDFSFARHDTFLVGRSRHAHFQLPLKDKYVSRIHFMVEINPPQCRLVDMGSHNGTFVNSQRVLSVDLKDGDQVRAGHSLFRVTLEAEATDTAATIVPAPAPSGEMSVAPDRIPGYNLLGKRREDSLGSVYEATRMADGLPVTLRLLVPAMSGNRAQVDAFLYEAQSLRTLEHPGIVRFVEGGDADGILFFVFEQERGLDAAKLLTGQGPFGERRALRVLDQALSALAYAHGQGMVHRDLKPSNIIIEGEEGQETTRLADFGLARIYHNSQLSGLSITRDITASVAFLPPELITNYREASQGSDQYAAAATLYFLLTGHPVYDFPTEAHLQYSLLLQTQPVPIRQRRPELPDALVSAIHKALQRNPANRYKDIAGFREALRRATRY